MYIENSQRSKSKSSASRKKSSNSQLEKCKLKDNEIPIYALRTEKLKKAIILLSVL